MLNVLDLVNSLRRGLLENEAHGILYLQNKIGEDNNFLEKVTKFVDSSYVISILFPVFASLDTTLGFRVLLVSSVTEWFSTILKWFLFGSRPYWWVREAEVNIPLKQSEITCETGPGSPSGHVMGCAAVGYVFVLWMQDWIRDNSYPGRLRQFFTTFLWLMYLSLNIIVALSRVIIAAHFFHQCILGFVAGIFIAKLLVSESKCSLWLWLRNGRKSRKILTALIMSFISVSSYFLLKYFGVDPGWSIKLAFKWCQRPDTISVTTTPIYSLARDCGCFMGMALALPLKARKFFPLVGATVTTLFFAGTKMLRPLMPSQDPFQFYLFLYLDNFFTSLSLLTFIPYIASMETEDLMLEVGSNAS